MLDMTLQGNAKFNQIASKVKNFTKLNDGVSFIKLGRKLRKFGAIEVSNIVEMGAAILHI